MKTIDLVYAFIEERKKLGKWSFRWDDFFEKYEVPGDIQSNDLVNTIISEAFRRCPELAKQE